MSSNGDSERKVLYHGVFQKKKLGCTGLEMLDRELFKKKKTAMENDQAHTMLYRTDYKSEITAGNLFFITHRKRI